MTSFTTDYYSLNSPDGGAFRKSPLTDPWQLGMTTSKGHLPGASGNFHYSAKLLSCLSPTGAQDTHRHARCKDTHFAPEALSSDCVMYYLFGVDGCRSILLIMIANDWATAITLTGPTFNGGESSCECCC